MYKLLLGHTVNQEQVIPSSPIAVAQDPKPLILRIGTVKGWVFINHSEAQAQ